MKPVPRSEAFPPGRVLAGLALLLSLFVCKPRTQWPAAEFEGEWPQAVTTLVETRVAAPPLPERTRHNPLWPEGWAEAMALGLGSYRIGPGEPHRRRADLGAGSEAARGERGSLASIFHHTDDQLTDAESPTRSVGMDNTAFPGAARPNEIYGCFALDAVVRTVNQLKARSHIDFVVVTGDQADSAQLNETRWLVQILDGTGPVHCDSGADDAAPDELGLDPLAPFAPAGLRVPWYQVPGNHDLLIGGRVAPHPEDEAIAVGAESALGTRDLSRPGGPLIDVRIPPDPDRRLLLRRDLIKVYFDSPATPGPPGHGFRSEGREAGITWYTADPLAPVPLRLIGLDSVNTQGGAEGAMARAQYNFLTSELARAARERVLVIVLSHHETYNIEVSGEGVVLAETLRQYDNVILHLYGHGHRNEVRAYPAQDGRPPTHGFWGIQTSALSDWPSQSRVLEVVWNGGDATLSVFSTMVDHAAPPHSRAEAHRIRTLVDWQSGWGVGRESPGAETDRNVELVIPIPGDIDAALDRLALPRSIESLDTLRLDPR